MKEKTGMKNETFSFFFFKGVSCFKTKNKLRKLFVVTGMKFDRMDKKYKHNYKKKKEKKS